LTQAQGVKVIGAEPEKFSSERGRTKVLTKRKRGGDPPEWRKKAAETGGYSELQLRRIRKSS